MTKLKQNRIQNAFLFKINDPNTVINVTLVPELVSDYAKVKLAERGPRTIFSKTNIEPGDYLLTENGKFIGIMTSKDSCYVLPAKLPPQDNRHHIPVTKPPGEKYYKAFVNSAREARKMMRDFER